MGASYAILFSNVIRSIMAKLGLLQRDHAASLYPPIRGGQTL